MCFRTVIYSSFEFLLHDPHTHIITQATDSHCVEEGLDMETKYESKIRSAVMTHTSTNVKPFKPSICISSVLSCVIMTAKLNLIKRHYVPSLTETK